MEGLTAIRVIHDPPAAGTWNMAVDEMMLETVATSGQPTLRFYQWQEPTLSLGYFQNLEDRKSHAASQDCAVVRRSTGGGAILHDRELTYSIALPIANRWSSEATALYEVLHGGLVATLAGMGVNATLCPHTLHSLDTEFLCFQRRAKGDVLVGEHKVAGSAQRRRQGALLQHGSVVLSRSPAAPEIWGLSELGLVLSPETLATALSQELSETWRKIHLVLGNWSDDEIESAHTLQNARFSHPDWLSRRNTR